jgi:hypothetical protein
VLVGTAAIVLTLVFFGGFLAVLALVFPEGQDLRVLLQADRTRSETAWASARGRSANGGLGQILASLQVLSPAVRKRAAGGIAWTQTGTGAEFRAGDGIQTGSEGRALVEFGSTQIRLESNSLVILGVEPGPAGEDSPDSAPSHGLVVVEGEVAARVGSGAGSALEIGLPSGVAAVSGRNGSRADIVVAVDRDRSTRVTALDGVVNLQVQGRRVVIGPRQSAHVGAEGGLSPPLPIPETPAIESPEDGAQFESLDLPPKVRFRWRSAAGPGEYRLRVARDPGMAEVVVDERVATEFLDWGRFEPGRYYWQVTRSVDGVPSAPSAVRRLVVSGEAHPLTLTVEPPPARVDGLRYEVRGRASPGASVFVKGRPAVVGPDGSFVAEVVLEPGANIVLVEALAKGGRSVYSSHVIHAKPR